MVSPGPSASQMKKHHREVDDQPAEERRTSNSIFGGPRNLNSSIPSIPRRRVINSRIKPSPTLSPGLIYGRGDARWRSKTRTFYVVADVDKFDKKSLVDGVASHDHGYETCNNTGQINPQFNYPALFRKGILHIRHILSENFRII